MFLSSIRFLLLIVEQSFNPDLKRQSLDAILELLLQEQYRRYIIHTFRPLLFLLITELPNFVFERVTSEDEKTPTSCLQIELLASVLSQLLPACPQCLR